MTLDDMLKNIDGIINGSAEDELLFNNANKPSERFPTQRDMAAGEVSKYLTMKDMPEEILKAHQEGFLHFHK